MVLFLSTILVFFPKEVKYLKNKILDIIKIYSKTMESTELTPRQIIINRRRRADAQQAEMREKAKKLRLERERAPRSPFGGFPRRNVIPQISPQVKESRTYKEDRASRVLSRNMRNNILGIYEGVGLIPRIKVTPSKQDIKRGYLTSGDFSGNSIETVIDGGKIRWVVVVPNHPRYSQRTITTGGNNLQRLYTKLEKLRRGWINFVLEQSEVYDIKQYPVGVRPATTIEDRRTVGDVFSTPMLESYSMELDRHAKNSTWCTNTNKCVPDYIIKHYGQIKRFIKKCTYENIEKIAGTYPWPEPNKNGYAIPHLIKIAENFGVSMYAIEDDRLICIHEPSKRSEQKAMVFTVKNNHLYPIFEPKHVKRWVEKAKKISSNIHKKKDTEESAAVVETTPFHRIKNEWGSDSLPIRLMEHAYDINTQPNADVIMNGNNIVHYENNGVKYDFKTHEINGMSLVEFVKKTEKWEAIPQSYVSPEVRAALGAPNVKHRTHYGGVRTGVEIARESRRGDIIET
ncbi:hypothetical protein N9991_00730, partial [bacterium]|nr:hypothetical protein [bacterium]